MTEITAVTISQQTASRKYALLGIGALVVAFASWKLMEASQSSIHHFTAAIEQSAVSHTAEHSTPHESHLHPAETPALYSVIPFVSLLLCIALLPLFRKTEHWWENNWNRLLVACSLGVLTLFYYAFLYGQGVVDHSSHAHAVSTPGLHTALVVFKNAILVEYIPFIMLLFSLYVISGGIAVEGHLVGRPRLNTAIIGLGGLLASFIGTTGAAMLLIRPLLKANVKRQYVSHTVIFFIFVACNTGGCLLPIGDPPLFLGYLRKVPFTWTLGLWPMWLFVNVALLAVYYLWDKKIYKREDHADVEEIPEHPEPFKIKGAHNFFWLGGVILCVALLDPNKAIPGTNWHAPLYFREVMMLILAGVSLWLTKVSIRQQNAFNYDAILEVAALFIGIFICMQAPVQILNIHGPNLGFDSPTKFYWGTGILSSFLDNAPTYVVFFETAKAMEPSGNIIAGVSESMLIAISLGAVFMGAMTYIGNGPNFMVKAIAEKNNVKMPSFFGYMAYSCAILLPISILMNLILILSKQW